MGVHLVIKRGHWSVDPAAKHIPMHIYMHIQPCWLQALLLDMTIAFTIAAGTYRSITRDQLDYLGSRWFMILAAHVNWLRNPATWYQMGIGLWYDVEGNISFPGKLC